MNPIYIFRGFSEYTVKTSNHSEFLSRIKKTIPLRNVKINDNGVIKFICFYDSRKQVEIKIKEADAQILNKKFGGLPYIFHSNRKRIGLLIGGLIIYLYIMLSQLFVWEIRVEGNEKVNDIEIIKTLRDIGFTEGVFKKSVDIDSLVNNFLIREKRISWIAINFDGTVAHIEVREGKNPDMFKKRKNVNLVASHDGIIMRTDIIEGGTLVKKGDVVYKNQLLVNAFIDREEMSTLRGAKGNVWAYTERCICVNVPLKYREKNYTGNTQKNLSLAVLGKNFEIINRKGLFNMYDLSYDSFGSINNGKYSLPFTMQVENIREYEPLICIRSEKEALSLAIQISDERIKEITPTYTVATKKTEYKIEDDILKFTCYYTGIENIAKELEFEMS